MRHCLIILPLAFCLSTLAQDTSPFIAGTEKFIDSLKKALPKANDQERIDILCQLSWGYRVINGDTSQHYVQQAFKEASALQNKRGLAIVLVYLGYYEEANSNFQKAKPLFEQSLAIAKNTDINWYVAEAYLLLMNTHRNLSEYADMLKVAEEAEPVIKKRKDIARLAILYSLKARAYQALSRTYEQLHFLNESAHLNKKVGNLKGSFDAMIEIGNTYFEMHEFGTALQYYKRSLTYTDPKMRTSYNGYHKVGNVYMELTQFDSALYYYNHALMLLKQTSKDAAKIKTDVLGTEIKIGEVYLKMGLYDKALGYFLPFLNFFRNKNDVNKIVQVLPKIGNAYLGKADYQAALNYGRELLQLCRTNKTAKAYRYAYALLATSLEKINRPDSAYHYLKLASVLRDSIEQGTYKSNLTFFKTMMESKERELKIELLNKDNDLLNKDNELKEQKLDLLNVMIENDAAASKIALLNKDNQLKQQELDLLSAKVENETAGSKINLLNKNNELLNKDNELLNKDNQLKKQRLNLLVGGLTGLLILALVFVRYVNVKRKNEAHRRALLENELQIQKLESEKKQVSLQRHASELEMQALRSQMNPHFIFNCLNAINHFILNNETETASDYLTKFSRLIRQVLQNSSKKTIPLADEIDTLRLYIELEQVRFKNRFEFSITVDGDIDADGIIIPPMLLQPFVENAIWHGLMQKEDNGELTIDITRKGERLLCTITDNGVGRNNANANKNPLSQKKSMGMQITATRLKMLEQSGDFTVIDLNDKQGKSNGTKVVVTIPAVMADMMAA